jgi:hypothetical protein
VLPELGVPLEELLAAPDVVDEDVETARLPLDPASRSATASGSEWSTATAVAAPPTSPIRAAVSSMVSDRP